MNTQKIKNTFTNTIKLATTAGILASSVLASAETDATLEKYNTTIDSAFEDISFGKSYRKMWDPGTKRIERYYPRKPFETTPRKVPGPKPRPWWK